MLPYISVFGREVPVYSLAAIIGCLFAVLYFETGKRRKWCDSADTEMAFLWGGLGALIGAKLLSIMTQLPDFVRDLPALYNNTAAFMEKYLFSGFVFYGGLYGGLTAAWLYARHRRIPFCDIAACLAPTLPLIHGFGRVGCFFVGCCYGIPAGTCFPGIAYHNSSVAPNDIPLIPVQLIEAVAEIILFLCMLVILRKGKERGYAALSTYLVGYGILRFLLEFLRGDVYRGFIGPLSVSQWISFVTIIVGFLILIPHTKRSMGKGFYIAKH